MRGRHLTIAGALALAMFMAKDAPAWEATSTHPGLTEQAAVTSKLHERLKRMFDAERGLYTPLTVPPPDAPALFKVLRKLNPSQGYVPDGRGRLYAMGWLAAGSVIADSPRSFAVNHFYDPISKHGAVGHSYSLRTKWLARIMGESLPHASSNALAWITDKRNPMNLSGFWSQYEKAVRAGTPAERSRHLAGTLLAAGALLHVLEDMGSPSHVRNDIKAHLQQLGSPLDIGSRFERIAALGFGRLGVPGSQASTTARSLHALISNPNHTGLADVTARSWFSRFTLPRTIHIDHITIAGIVRLVAAHYKVKPAAITAKPAKGAKSSVPRAMAIYLAITHTPAAYTKLAAAFGEKRRTPLLFAAAQIIEDAKSDVALAKAVSTLKGDISASVIGTRLDKSLRRADPAPLNRLDLAAARQPKGARLVDANGVCVARYRLRGLTLSWTLDDDCIAEQLRAILPQVVSYGAGALNWLFRGELTVRARVGAIAVSARGLGLGKGSIDLFWDDNRGVRTRYATIKVRGGKAGAVLARGNRPPKTAHRITALFRGLDAKGNELVATGTTKLR